MTRTIIFPAVILLAAGIACGKLDLSPKEGNQPASVVSFEGRVPAFDTKVTRDETTGITQWEAGDRISILYGDEGQCYATASRGGSTTTFVTDGPIEEGASEYCAVYPASRKATYANGILDVDFYQSYAPALFRHSAICVARTETCGGALSFHSLGSIIKFTTDKNNIYESRLSVYGNSKEIINLVGGDSEMPYTAGTYYIPLPAGVSSTGFSLRLKNADGEDYPALYRPESREFIASRIYNVGTVETKLFGTDNGGSNSFRLMSFNILRADLPTDAPERHWENRKASCLAMIAADSPDILGLQECTSVQRNDILNAFPKYGAVGVSVEGDKISAYPAISSNPIFYDGNKFLLEDWGTFWLSKTPETIGSHTWYYNKPRTATWARFKVKGTDFHFVCICLHLQDNTSKLDGQYEGQGSTYGPRCRSMELQVVVSKLGEINPDGYPMVVFGDCNANGTEDAFNELREGFSLARIRATNADSGRTYNGFSPSGNSDKTIDNIFYKGFSASTFAVDRNEYAGVTYISDHYPVYVDLTPLPTTQLSSDLDPWNETDIL